MNDTVMNQHTTTSQMELTLKNTRTPRPPRRRQPTRTERAAWWFGEMRHTVDQAVSWSAKPATTRQQIQPALA